MRTFCLMFLVLAAAPAFADEPAPGLDWSLVGAISPEYRVPAAWGVTFGAGTTGIVLAGWGLGLFGSPGSQPWRVSVPAVAWGTIFLCASGIALDWLLSNR